MAENCDLEDNKKDINKKQTIGTVESLLFMKF